VNCKTSQMCGTGILYMNIRCKIFNFWCGVVDTFAALGCCTGLVGSLLLTFWDNASALEDGTDMLSQLVGNQLPTSKAQHSRRSNSQHSELQCTECMISTINILAVNVNTNPLPLMLKSHRKESHHHTQPHL